jgi:hypothetical protein
MAWTDNDDELSVQGQEQGEAIIKGDQFRGRGEEMLKRITFEAIQTLIIFLPVRQRTSLSLSVMRWPS